MIKLYIKENIKSEELLKEVFKEFNITDEIIYNEYKKPYLKNNSYFFNLSHSNNVTVCALSDKEIGIDIEAITMKEKIIKKICNENELKQIKNADDFTKIWTKKEAYVKYVGIGLSYGLENVDTTKLKFTTKKYKDYYISIYEEN